MSRKIFTRVVTNFSFFNQFSGDILSSSLVFFALSYACFFLFFFFLFLCLFFEINNLYSDTHLTKRAGE